MDYTMKLILVGDGSLVLIKYYEDGTPKKSVLIPAGKFAFAELSGYLSTLTGKQVLDLVDFICPDNLSLDNLEQMETAKLKTEDDDGYSPSMLNKQ